MRSNPLPLDMIAAFQDYVKNHHPLGGFYMAVLENNLREAIFRSDRENTELIPDIIGYLQYNVPSRCWGSKKSVDEWLDYEKPPRPPLGECPQCHASPPYTHKMSCTDLTNPNRK